MMSEMQQHLQPMGLGESRNVGIEIGITLAQFTESWKKFFVKHEPIAAGMGRDDGYAFLEG
jgi:hypothetical protein